MSRSWSFLRSCCKVEELGKDDLTWGLRPLNGHCPLSVGTDCPLRLGTEPIFCRILGRRVATTCSQARSEGRCAGWVLWEGRRVAKTCSQKEGALAGRALGVERAGKVNDGRRALPKLRRVGRCDSRTPFDCPRWGLFTFHPVATKRELHAVRFCMEQKMLGVPIPIAGKCLFVILG